MARKIIIRPLKNSPVYIWSSEPEKQRVKFIINKKRLAFLIYSPQGDKQPSFDVCLYTIDRPGANLFLNSNPIDGYKARKTKRVKRGKLVRGVGWGITKLDAVADLLVWGNKLKVELGELLDEALKATFLIKYSFEHFANARPWLSCD
jgi:hypothetical protein